MMSDVTVRPARAEDFEALYGHPAPYTLRAVVAEQDGEVLGVMGIFHANPLMAFCRVTPRLKEQYPTMILRAAKAFPSLLSYYSEPVYALPDPDEPHARDILQKAGFQRDESREIEVYVWT